MFLFIHGTGATNSFWLPQIRGILGLDQSYSDKFLLDLFTISLPGHPKNDKYFDLSDLEKFIEQEAAERHQKQMELADKLFFSKNQEAVAALKEDKLILIGHSVGGVAALYFALRNSSRVNKLILVSCGFNFNPISVAFLELFYEKIIFKFNLKRVIKLFDYVKNIRYKTILSICIDNPERKGLRSCKDIIKDYQFDKIYKKMSLDEQLLFNEIPVLGIGGQFDPLTPSGSLRKLRKYLDEQNKLLSLRKTVVGPNKPGLTNFKYKIYSFAGHEPMDDKTKDFVSDVKDFLG